MELEGIVKGFSGSFCIYLNENYLQIELKRDRLVQKEIRGNGADFLPIFSENMHCIIVNFWYNGKAKRLLENRSK